MKFYLVGILSLIGSVGARVANYDPWTGTNKGDPKHSDPGFHQKNNLPTKEGLQFVIDGRADYYAGTNAYWIPFLTDNTDVDMVMDHLQRSGLSILRVWGFSDVNEIPTDGSVWFHLIKNGTSLINDGPDGLQRLDYVVKSAETHDVKLIINFVNNWDSYGGIPAYNAAFGGNTTSWYTDDASQHAYRQYIKSVISRYVGSPAVFAWELCNEPRCHGCDTDVIYNWALSTSAYVKSLEPGRMVCIGDEGMGLTTDSDGSYPFSYDEGVDFQKNINIPDVDFGTFHLYPSQWGEEDPWGNLWVTAHGAVCANAGKPCLMEEYGSLAHCSSEGPWQQTALKTKGIAADSFWQYGDHLSSGLSPNDGYTIYRGTANYTCLVTDHVKAIRDLSRNW